MTHSWKVSLDTYGIEIAHTTNKKNMLHLANEICSFMGKGLIDNSAIPDTSWKPKTSFGKFFNRPIGK